MWHRPIALVNGLVVADEGLASSIRFDRVVLGVDERPRRHDVVVDLEGAIVFPGLINAHDHLELNHFGRLRFRERYANAVEWFADVGPRLRTDPRLVRGRQIPLRDRLLIGGLKNLLAGVTTVAHHNPFYRELAWGLPIRVVRRYGWAHSFALQHAPVGARGEPGGLIAERYRQTPPTWPFVVHVAEGTDEAAGRELHQLDALGCLGPNTVIVHGVGATTADWERARTRGAGLVWCPGSNLFLFRTTVDPRSLAGDGARMLVALGTDSRLSGSADLLDELRLACAESVLEARRLVRMVTTDAATLLRCPGAGRLAPGVPADLIAFPRRSDDPYAALLAAARRDLQLVAVGGHPLVAAPRLSPLFAARRREAVCVHVDGEARLFDGALARRVRSCSVQEPGLGCHA